MVFRHTSRARGLSRPQSGLGSGTVQTTIVLGDYPDHHRSRGLTRPSSFSGTVQTTIVLGDCPDHHRAQGLSRPPLCTGTVQTTIVLGDCSDHSNARGLLRPLYEHCSETALLGYM